MKCLGMDNNLIEKARVHVPVIAQKDQRSTHQAIMYHLERVMNEVRLLGSYLVWVSVRRNEGPKT